MENGFKDYTENPTEIFEICLEENIKIKAIPSAINANHKSCVPYVSGILHLGGDSFLEFYGQDAFHENIEKAKLYLDSSENTKNKITLQGLYLPRSAGGIFQISSLKLGNLEEISLDGPRMT